MKKIGIIIFLIFTLMIVAIGYAQTTEEPASQIINIKELNNDYK